jgi:Fic family protein
MGASQLPDDLQQEAMIDFMVAEAIKTSQIERETIDPEDVRSSILTQLGLVSTHLTVKDPRSRGIAELMISMSRQRRVVHRLFQAGVDGFEGGVNAQKYMKIAACSKATATRDLSDLLAKGCLASLPGGGRNTRYALAL